MPTRKVSVVMSSAALSSQGTIPTPEQVCAAAKAVGYALGDQDYALVRGAANGKVQGEGRCQLGDVLGIKPRIGPKH